MNQVHRKLFCRSTEDSVNFHVGKVFDSVNPLVVKFVEIIGTPTKPGLNFDFLSCVI